MPCYYPIVAYRARHRNENGKRPLVFTKQEGYVDQELKIPCGQCIGCRLERSRQWAIRCMHEAASHEKNCFITLTYRDEELPVTEQGVPSLNKRDFVLFMKRLRKQYGKRKIRFFHCGEYGELLLRPHHHAAIFGVDFGDDKTLWSMRGNTPLYRSQRLETLWPHGHSTIGELTWESAAYIARYITKKITGQSANSHYGGIQPEYITMSRVPGIGKKWFDRYYRDLYRTDRCVVRSQIICKPAKYYDKKYDETHHHQLERIKYRRVKNRPPDADYSQLSIREQNVKITMQKKFKRSYENDSSNNGNSGF